MLGKLEKMDTFRRLIEDSKDDEYANNESVQILVFEAQSLENNKERLNELDQKNKQNQDSIKEITTRLEALKNEKFIDKLFQFAENRAEKKEIEETLQRLNRVLKQNKNKIIAIREEIRLQELAISCYEKYLNAIGITREEFLEEHKRRVEIQEKERKMSRSGDYHIDPYPELTEFYKEVGRGNLLDTPYNRINHPKARFVSSKEQAAKQM